MNWKEGNENVKNNLWHERCEKERKFARPNSTFSLSHDQLKTTMVSDSVVNRQRRFLNSAAASLQTLARFIGEDTDPELSPYVNQFRKRVATASSASGGSGAAKRPQTALSSASSRVSRQPKWRHPLATSDDYGWTPEINKEPWKDRRFYFGLGSSDVTKGFHERMQGSKKKV